VRVDVSFDLLLIAWVRYQGSGCGFVSCGLCHRVCLLWLVELKLGFKSFDRSVATVGG
jgi:hypothetical protein